MILSPLFTALALFLAAGPVVAATYYVDPARGSDAHDGRSVSTAWQTLARANAALRPGDTCLLRGGVHPDAQLAPARSGAPGKPITYAAYEGETPELPGSDAESTVLLQDRSYITVRGLTVRSRTHGWVVKVDGKGAQHNRIERCDVSDPEGYAPIVLAHEASYNVVADCVVHDTGHGEEGSGDAIVLNYGAHHNTIVRNRLYNSCHSQFLVINGSHHNTFRDNELYGTNRAWSGAGVNLCLYADYNLILNNRIHDLGYSRADKCAIQINTKGNVIRGNIIYNVGGYGISPESYAYRGDRQEAVANVIENNTVYRCGRQGLYLYSAGDCLGRDNRFSRNIVVGSPREWGGTSVWLLVFDLRRLKEPLAPGDWLGNRFEDNVFQPIDAGDALPALYSPPATTYTLEALQSQFPAVFRGNVEADPQFVDPAKADFRLKPTSLARAKRAGATFAKGR